VGPQLHTKSLSRLVGVSVDFSPHKMGRGFWLVRPLLSLLFASVDEGVPSVVTGRGSERKPRVSSLLWGGGNFRN